MICHHGRHLDVGIIDTRALRPELTRGDTQSMPKKGNGPTLRMARSPFSGNLEEKKYIYMNFIADVL